MISSASKLKDCEITSWRRDMLSWLLDGQILGVDGTVYSWHDPVKPGYPYPEIGGYLLELLAQEGSDTAAARQRIAAWLVSTIDWQGGVGRDGLIYLFDTAILLGGLLAHRRAGGQVDDRVLTRVYSFVADLIVARGAARDGQGNVVTGNTWSLSFGCHLLKVLRILEVYHRHTGQVGCFLLIEQLLGDLCPLYMEGRFQAFAATSASQLHAHCYALEGLLAYIPKARPYRPELRKLLHGGAEWLAHVQHTDGSLPEWSDGRNGWGKSRADVAAQAIRIWTVVDPDRYRLARERSLKFLRRLHAPRRGLCFEPASASINTWATIFAVQALEWWKAPRPAEII